MLPHLTQKELYHSARVMGMSAGEYCAQFLSTDKSVRDAAAKKLGRMGKEGAYAVLPLLTADDWVFRYRACEVIGLSGCFELAKRIAPLLSDTNADVRRMAVQSLGKIGNAEYADLVKPLTKDADAAVIREAFRTLQKWKKD